jgi:hypothetical protein
MTTNRSPIPDPDEPPCTAGSRVSGALRYAAIAATQAPVAWQRMEALGFPMDDCTRMALLGSQLGQGLVHGWATCGRGPTDVLRG